MRRARGSQRKTKTRERLREDWIGLGALAGGYGRRCHGNGAEEEEEGSVSASWGRASALVREPASGPSWEQIMD